jgi:hypothetical protein
VKEKIVRLALVGTLALGSAGAVACSDKTQNDLGKVGHDLGHDVQKGVDKLDDNDSK